MSVIKRRVSELVKLLKLKVKEDELEQFLMAADDTEAVKALQAVLAQTQAFANEDELNNWLKVRVDQAKKDAQGSIYADTLTKIENDLKEEFGIEKVAGQKLRDYVKHIVGEKAKNPNESEDLKTLRKSAQELQVQVAEANKKAEQAEAKALKAQEQAQVDLDLVPAVRGWEYDVDPKYAGVFHNTLTSEFKKRFEAKLEDGKVVYYDRNTKLPMVDIANGNAPRTASSLLTEFAAEVVPTKKAPTPPTGAGHQQQQGRPPVGGQGPINYALYKDAKSLQEHLVKSGVNPISEEGRKAMEGWGDHQVQQMRKTPEPGK